VLLRGALEDSFVAEVKKGKMASKLCSNEINRFNHNGLNSRVSNLLRKHFASSINHDNWEGQETPSPWPKVNKSVF